MVERGAKKYVGEGEVARVVAGEVVADLLERGPHILPQQPLESVVGHVRVHQLAKRACTLDCGVCLTDVSISVN
jgi:hypothetical protein